MRQRLIASFLGRTVLSHGPFGLLPLHGRRARTQALAHAPLPLPLPVLLVRNRNLLSTTLKERGALYTKPVGWRHYIMTLVPGGP